MCASAALRVGGSESNTAGLVPPAGVGAELHLIPVARPATAPGHRQPTRHTGFARQRSLVTAKGSSRFCHHQFTQPKAGKAFIRATKHSGRTSNTWPQVTAEQTGLTQSFSMV